MRVYGLILAGGTGSRMGGADKALLPLGGRTLLDHVRDRISGQVEALALSANGDVERFADYGLPVLRDPLDFPPGATGPLAGVLAGLIWAAAEDADMLCTVAVDTPFFPADLVTRLTDAAEGGTRPALAAADDGAHPTFALWPCTLAPALKTALLEGRRGIRAFADQHGAIEVRFDTARQPFFNINWPDDLSEAERMVSERPA